MEALLLSHNVNIEKTESKGLFSVLARYRRRAGLYLGAVLFFATVYVSGLFIWEVNIEGNANVSEREIRGLLEKHGVSVGTYIPALELDSVCNGALAESDKLSWMAINMNGTSANVVVREIEAWGKKEVSSAAANIVAARDGQIELVEAYAGVGTVNIGDAVREGDLLISGVIENPNSPPSFLRAAGKVYARTTRVLRVEIPFDFEKKSYTGYSVSEKTVNFFGKSINLSIKGGNLPEKYDKIEKEAPLSVFGLVSVPISVNTTEYLEYELTADRRKETDAVRIAHIELSLLLEEALSGAELLRKNTSGYFTDTSYVLECELYVIEDIACVSEFDTE